MLDVLCHLPLFSPASDAVTALEQAAADGVTALVSAGMDPRDDERLPAGREDAPVVHRAWGVHPERASDEHRDDQLAALVRRLARGDAGPSRAVAIGECGLDHRDGQPPLAVQERTLRAQLALARARRLPVILHLVGAWARALDIIGEEGPLPAGGIWHAFSGPKEAIAPATELGLSLSVGALVQNTHAKRLHDALPLVPRDRLVVETDMPHTPAVSLLDVVAGVARVRGEQLEAVAAYTADNARRLFQV